MNDPFFTRANTLVIPRGLGRGIVLFSLPDYMPWIDVYSTGGCASSLISFDSFACTRSCELLGKRYVLKRACFLLRSLTFAYMYLRNIFVLSLKLRTFWWRARSRPLLFRYSLPFVSLEFLLEYINSYMQVVIRQVQWKKQNELERRLRFEKRK